MKSTYALITAARNEEKYIGNTIESVAAQTILPVQWIIVNDGSTDRTREIILDRSKEHAFISMIELEHDNPRDFASKVRALMIGINSLNKDPAPDFFGVLDSDITFESAYYEQVLVEFQNNGRLGIAGGVLFDVYPHGLKKRNWRKHTVAGGIQLFRRACFEAIGGFLPLPYGSEDSIAEISARMHGWEVQSFRHITGLHHKLTGSAQGASLSYAFKLGRRDYSYGVLFFFEFIKCIIRISDRPFFLQSLFCILGYAWSFIRREKRTVSKSFIRFYREEQLRRLKVFLKPFFNRKGRERL